VVLPNVTISVPILKPALFVTRHYGSSAAHVNDQLAPSRINLKPLSDKEGLFLAEKLLHWVHKFVQKMSKSQEGGTERAKLKSGTGKVFHRLVDQNAFHSKMYDSQAEYNTITEPKEDDNVENINEYIEEKPEHNRIKVADNTVHRSKRNPRCLHTCLKRGLLHPAQCHMLC